jgi:hypothetical protein
MAQQIVRNFHIYEELSLKFWAKAEDFGTD